MLLNDLTELTRVQISSISGNTVQTTLNGRDIVQNLGSQKWSITATIPIMEEKNYMPVAGALASLDGAYGEFQLRLPIGVTNPDKANGTVSALATAGGSVVTTATHGAVHVGTFIRFSNHSKVYMIQAFTPNQITVTPPLRADVPVDTFIIYDQPIMNVRLNSDFTGFDIRTDGLSNPYDIQVTEVI